MKYQKVFLKHIQIYDQKTTTIASLNNFYQIYT